MIKKIHTIRKIGVFQDYRRNGDLRDFDDKNIIYGWNYSGKTTLSRLISFLDKESDIDTDFSNVEFDIELDDNTRINQSNRTSSPVLVKVFNSDFVRKNLRFDSDERMQGIKFAVGNVAVIMNQIQDIKKSIDGEKKKIDRKQRYVEKYKLLESEFTNEARNISEILSLGRTFTKRTIWQYIEAWHSIRIEDIIIKDSIKLERVRTAATSQVTGSVVIINTPTINYSTLYSQVEAVLQKQPLSSNDDTLLSGNKDLYDWVKNGLLIYQQHPSIERCAFCGGIITKEGRMAELNRFYSNEAAKVKTEIESIKRNINFEKQYFSNLEWSRISENDLEQTSRKSFKDLKESYSKVRDRYIALLNILESKLDEKYSSELFNPMQLGVIDDSAKTALEEWIQRVKFVFEQSNTTIQNYESIQKEAIEKYKKHLIADFLINVDFRKVEQKNALANRRIGKINALIDKKEHDIKLLESRLDSLEKGKEEMNEYIQLFLNRIDLKIETTEDNYFILKRGDNVAKHLSDGEKTAIAFSHFMVSLKSLKDSNKLKDYVVFIDDPISSLDANHIAQVCTMINTFFFQKGLDSENPDRICNCFNQLFIATHNFELFSFLKDANNINRKKKITRPDGSKSEVPSCNYFMIKKLNENESTIINIPKTLSKYKSEYVYLFSEINQFKEDGYPEERAYMMPNIVRRFIEIYTLMKLPGNTDEIDNRIKILFPDRIVELKVLHHFSHFTSFDRVTKHSELILRIKDVVEDLFIILADDPKHLESLYDGIK